MVEEFAIDAKALELDKKQLANPEKIIEAMAESRVSLGNRLSALEEEVERRVLDTFDQVNRSIVETSEQIKGQITKPIQELQERVQSVREKVKSSPYKSLSVAAAAGFGLGVFLGSRRHKIQSLPSDLLMRGTTSRFGGQSLGMASPWRDLISTLAVQLAQQAIQAGIVEVSRRRAEGRGD